MGLPISLFALMMTVVIGSLLFIIFSFSITVIVSVFLLDGVMYIALTHIAKNPSLMHIKKVFPQTISNKKGSRLYYQGP
jgi:hypothetical protein